MNFISRSRPTRVSSNLVSESDKWRVDRRFSHRVTDTVESEDEEEDTEDEVKDWTQELMDQGSTTKTTQDVEVHLTRKQTLILSTLVPDEILLLEKFDTGYTKRFVGVLLMADVSGYTALSERYNNTGKGGTYRLTVTLNTYLGSLVELIYSHGGDVLKFAGDAFLALWKTDKRCFLNHTIHAVIACALIIQHTYGSYETDVKVNLKVKLAIAAGNLIFAPIGTGIDMNYVMFGLPVMEAKKAESVCSSGEVKLAPTAWGHCYSRNYDHEVDEDGHVTIKSILYDPREKDVTKPFHGFGNLLRNVKSTFAGIENSDVLWDSEIAVNSIDAQRKAEALQMRTTIRRAEQLNIGADIRKFMIRPVLTQIDAHQPLEYLTEMRQVSVLFITLKPRTCPFLQLVTIANNSYQITCDMVYKSMGCVNKIILFDKDVMILVVFGLRGFKHESEAQAALKCACGIKKAVSALDGVQEVSIGVTTGPVYSGVVGHPLRREFTVIGATVNKAARLMCNFRNKITCDETTFVKSKMSTNGFTLQPDTELKGINKPGKIYEYTEEIRVKQLHDIPMIPPLLNRIDEVEYFENWLDESHKSYRDFDGLLMIGECRIGKSRILEWMARNARNKGYHVIYLNLTSIHSATPYLALSQIIDQILGLGPNATTIAFDKEEKIVQILNVYEEDLCYLNSIIKTRFAYHEAMNYLDENKRKDKTTYMFKKLISALVETQVIFLDDLQSLDVSSWEYIRLMLDCPKIFTTFTLARGKFTSMHTWLYKVLISSNIRKITLGPLSSTWIAPLACQILDVDAVPNDLCNALRAQCKGMPGLVESFIVHLFSSGAIELKKITGDELKNWTDEDLQFPDQQLLQPQAVNASDQKCLEEFITKETTGEITICIVTNKLELNTNINVQNIDTLMMIEIDSLTPYQQLLLKIASVIGDVFSRDLLENIMYENNTMMTAKAIKRLFSMRILNCANNKWFHSKSVVSTTGFLDGSSNLSCGCPFEYDAEENGNLPKYAFCKIMKFKNKTSRKTCYELLPINQKKEFHSRVVSSLESQRLKCPDCGGSVMVVQSLMNIQGSKEVVEKNMSYGFDESDTSDSDESRYSHELKLKNDKLEPINDASSISDTSNPQIKTAKSAADGKIITSRLRTRKQSILTSRPSNLSNVIASVSKSVTDKRLSTKRVTLLNKHKKPMSQNLNPDAYLDTETRYRILDNIRAVTEADNDNDWRALGIYDSDDNERTMNKDQSKKSFSVKIEQGASKINFGKCTCGELNVLIYEQLIYHATQAELKRKVIEFLIQYSYLNIMASSFEDVLPKLMEAETYCYAKEALTYLTKFEKTRFLGKIYSLRAYVHLKRGATALAKLDMERATKLYGINLEKISNFFKIRHLNNIPFVSKEYRIKQALMKSDSILCLNVATILYSAIGDDTGARISAIQSVELVQKFECDVVQMCEAFSNAIQLELHRRTPEYTLVLETKANKWLRDLARPIKAEEISALGKLFHATFRARIARAQLTAAIRSGFRSIAVSSFLRLHSVSMEIIPDLFYVCLARRRIAEAVELALEVLRMARERFEFNYEVWYYALCMDLVLDAGFQLESPMDITRFGEYAVDAGMTGSAGGRRLIAGLWTYWLRSSTVGAMRFEAVALLWADHDGDGSLTTLISGLRLVEGMLVFLAYKVDDLRKIVDLMELRSLADKELARLERDARACKAILPWWLLLKAYSYGLSGRQANSVYSQALDEARKSKNRLAEALIHAATSDPQSWLRYARAGVFPSWREGDHRVQEEWDQMLYRIPTNRP